MSSWSKPSFEDFVSGSITWTSLEEVSLLRQKNLHPRDLPFKSSLGIQPSRVFQRPFKIKLKCPRGFSKLSKPLAILRKNLML